MPIQTATFTAQMKIRWSERRRVGAGGRVAGWGGGGRTRGRRQRRVKGAKEGRSTEMNHAQERGSRER